MLRYAGYAIVYAILLGAIAYTIRGERRQARRGDRLDSMIDVVAEREQEPQNHAWPPATTTAPGLFVSSGVHPCGCVVETTPEGARLTPCQIHDDDFVTHWEGRFSL